MSPCARIATLLLLAIHLAAAALPCPKAKLPDLAPDSGALAGSAAHPCPGHAHDESAPSTWLDSLCPCGCESGGAPPSLDGSRIPPALLLADLPALRASDRADLVAPPLRPARVALAPPDHVPLARA
jgi:hypothetical protein